MTDKPKDPRQCVFAVTQMADGTPLLFIGIPEAAWEHMRVGNTSNFDMTKSGLPFAVSLFGGKDQESLLALIEQGAKAGGLELRKDLKKDFSIDEPRKH